MTGEQEIASAIERYVMTEGRRRLLWLTKYASHAMTGKKEEIPLTSRRRWSSNDSEVSRGCFGFGGLRRDRDDSGGGMSC